MSDFYLIERALLDEVLGDLPPARAAALRERLHETTLRPPQATDPDYQAADFHREVLYPARLIAEQAGLLFGAVVSEPDATGNTLRHGRVHVTLNPTRAPGGGRVLKSLLREAGAG